MFLTIGAANKDIKWKRKFCRQSFSYYFGCLPNFPFTTSETKRDH